MRILNFFGSSHVSTKHGFAQTVTRHYSKIEDNFKSKYCVGEILSYPGATFVSSDKLDTFFTVASDQTKEVGYEGQINIVILGSNDQREINALPEFLVDSALEQFSFRLNSFVDKMLKAEMSTLILVTSVIPTELSNLFMDSIVRKVIR